jgi:hypothetical protein
MRRTLKMEMLIFYLIAIYISAIETSKERKEYKN